MLSNSLPDADLNLPEMKTKSPSCPAEGVHMYDNVWHISNTDKLSISENWSFRFRTVTINISETSNTAVLITLELKILIQIMAIAVI